LTGASENKTWVLLSFTSLNWDQETLAQVKALSDYEFFAVGPLGWPGSCVHSIDRQRMNFSDVLASIDIVLSKPGFGLVSECIANRKSLVYVDRDHFIEYPILVRGIEKYLKNIHIPQANLYAGNLLPYLEAITKAPEPTETLKAGGAEIISQILAETLTGQRSMPPEFQCKSTESAG